VGPVRSLRALEYIRTKVPGIHVPDAMVRRLRGVPAERVADEGMQIGVEIIQRVREISGVAEARALAGRGAQLLRIDEPFLAGYPEDVGIAVEAIDIVTRAWT
jgi:hypothetical protein